MEPAAVAGWCNVSILKQLKIPVNAQHSPRLVMNDGDYAGK